jgi:hypothetical protein
MSIQLTFGNRERGHMTLESAQFADSTRGLRSMCETAIGDLLHSGDPVDLRKASRLVFEEKCLEEVLWESFVDEWVEAAHELAGLRTTPLDYHSLTDWCVCGHSYDEHSLDCQSGCGCERFKRSRSVKRPKVRAAYVSPVSVNRTRCIELENARYRHLLGDLTGGV